MPSSIVRGRYLISKVISPTEAVVIPDGAVYQLDGTIVEIGPYADLAAKYTPDEVIGSLDHVVMPGLVNAHHHVGLTPFQLGSPDHPLELWFASRLAARDVDPYLDTLYSAFEMIESGVTTVQHLHSVRRGPASNWPKMAQQVLAAYRDIGMRVSYAFGIRDQNRLVYGPDEEFIRGLPPDLAPEVATLLGGMRISFDEYIATLFVDLYEGWGRNRAERVRIWLAPANLHWCSDEWLVAIKEHATRYRVGIHIHLLETMYQKLYALRRFGVTAVRHLHDLGFLGPEVTLGHGVWLSEEDIELVAETGTCICHNASSNLRLQSGICPLNHFAERGVRVALGIDEAGINDDRDLLQEMRLALKLHRVPGMDQPVPTPAQIFRMATEHGAFTTGFADRVPAAGGCGSLEPGKGADIVVMSLRNIAEPYLDPEVPILDAVVHRGRSADVETVIIAGEVVLRDRRFTRVNKADVLKELAATLKAPLTPDEVRRRELSRALFPYVRRFYDGWILPAGAPFYAPNQRD
jgi:cytosine/adenosine deaminase-related metal-dependent hydrolase